VIYAAIPLILAVVCVSLGRRMLTLFIILGYLEVEGFLKLVSNYNGVVHVGLDIIVLSVTAWTVLAGVVSRRARLPDLPWVRLILLYVVWLLLELANPYSAGLIPSLASYKVHLTMIPLYFLVAATLKTPTDVTRFIYGLALLALIPYVAALAQYALGPSSILDLSVRARQNISYYHEWRPFGTSAVPGGSSVMAFLVTPLAVVLLAAPKEWPRMRLVATLSVALAAGVFIVSGVRQVFLGCVLALVIMATLGLSRGRGRGALALVFAFGLGAGAYVAVQTFLKPMATEAVRTERNIPDIWRQGDVTKRLLTLSHASTYANARANPLAGIALRLTRYPFGAGLGRTGSAAGAFQGTLTSDAQGARIQREVGFSDNFFADMLVEVGIPGLVMLTTILVGMLVGAARLALQARDPVIVTTSAAIAGLLFAFLAMSWGSQPLLGNPITAFFWVLAGMLAAMRRMEAQAAAVEPAAEPEPAAVLA
jgi:hypothetical protein